MPEIVEGRRRGERCFLVGFEGSSLEGVGVEATAETGGGMVMEEALRFGGIFAFSFWRAWEVGGGGYGRWRIIQVDIIIYIYAYRVCALSPSHKQSKIFVLCRGAIGWLNNAEGLKSEPMGFL